MSRVLVTGVAAIVATAVISAIWAGLLTANLAATPGVPWSVPIAAGLLWLAWRWADGHGPPMRTAAQRHVSLRARSIAWVRFALALLAGGCALIALAGWWIVSFESGAMRGNRMPDLSAYPLVTVAPVIVMAAVVGGVTEEAAFRGYVQSLLERRHSPVIAVLVTAIVLAPEHAATQGFAVPTFVFYLLVDLMLGTTAYLTQSIVPGIVIHAAGLAMFFTLIWPADAARPTGAAAAAQLWFWIHVAQVGVFGVGSVFAYRRLARGRLATGSAEIATASK
jgi:membrane protease YdiL (CAAX protease family)